MAYSIDDRARSNVGACNDEAVDSVFFAEVESFISHDLEEKYKDECANNFLHNCLENRVVSKEGVTGGVRDHCWQRHVDEQHVQSTDICTSDLSTHHQDAKGEVNLLRVVSKHVSQRDRGVELRLRDSPAQDGEHPEANQDDGVVLSAEKQGEHKGAEELNDEFGSSEPDALAESHLRFHNNYN